MAFLIVHSDPVIRRGLERAVASHAGVRVIGLGRGQYALDWLSAHSSNVQWIICQNELPDIDGITIAERVAANPALSATPFILLTDVWDKETSLRGDLSAATARIDAIARAPLRISSFPNRFLDAAYRRRCSLRNTILAYVSEAKSARMEAVFPNGSDISKVGLNTGLWKAIIVATSPSEFMREFDAHSAVLGAVVVDPEMFGLLPAKWVRRTRKSHLGSSMIWTGVGHDPLAIRNIRTVCGFFVDPSDGAGKFAEKLLAMSRYAQGRWKMRVLRSKIRAAVEKESFFKARFLLNSVSHWQFEAWCMYGDLFLGAGKLKKARKAYQNAIDHNPCHPYPRYRLITILSKEGNPEFEALARVTAQYCPGNVPLLGQIESLRKGIN